MPQLPSGQQVSVSAERALSFARDGQLGLCAGFSMRMDVLADIAPLIDIVPHQVEVVAVEDEEAGPGEAYELTLADIETEKCSWSVADKQAFMNWLRQPKVDHWMRSMFEELRDLFLADQDDLLGESAGGLIEESPFPARSGQGRRAKGRGSR